MTIDLKGRPLHERVIVKLDDVLSTSQGGIFLPEDARESVNTGTIMALGNLANSEGENLEIGDRVMIQRMAGMPIEIDGHKYQLLMKHDIIFIYEN